MEELPTDQDITEPVSEPLTVPEASETPDPALIAFVEKGLTVADMETKDTPSD
jgi:hypothetical protein